MKRCSGVAVGLFALMALSLPVGTTAQMVLGLSGGITSATWRGSDATDLFGTGIDKGSRIGFNIGANLAIPVASRFAIVPGAHYAQKGVKYSQGSDEEKLKVDYFLIPLVGSLRVTGDDSSVGVQIFAGPEISFEVSCKETATVGGTTASVDCDTAGASNRQKTDIGFLGGAGLSFPLNDRLSLQVIGGVDVGMRKLDTSSDPANIKSMAFFGTVGVGIPVG